MGNDSWAAAALDTVSPSPHLQRPPQPCLCSLWLALLSLPAWIFFLLRKLHPGLNHCLHPADARSSSPCAPQPLHWLRPPPVSFAPPASSLTTSNPLPFSCASVALHRLFPAPGRPGCLPYLEPPSSFSSDHLFCDIFAHWPWQVCEPPGLSHLIHGPPLSPEASNSHPPPAAVNGT